MHLFCIIMTYRDGALAHIHYFFVSLQGETGSLSQYGFRCVIRVARLSLQMEKQDKKARLQVIRTIVGNCPFENQEELALELEKAGFSTTQTMLSRDLKQLRISKVRTRSGKSVYALPGVVYFDPAKTREELNATRWQLQFSGNLAVLHTPPGHASLVAYEIDEHKSQLLLGTVAGDDTVIVVMAENAGREEVRAVLMEVVPQLKKRRTSSG